jgi:DNA-binding helix-hairpin-helix protein with protein kinase domain
MSSLIPGTIVTAAEGKQIRIKKLLGVGGQGEVYEVDVEGKPQALKWYLPQGPEFKREQLHALISYIVPKSPPSPSFIWPKTVVDQDDRGFGYTMDLLPASFVGFERWIGQHLDTYPDFHATCNACVALAEAFRALHLSGAVFKDINLGGLFLDVETGEIRILDCDNVRPNDTPGTIFFPDFAAPEVVRGQSHCTINTDLHSIAVILFYIFVRSHPLLGAREASLNVFNVAAQKKLLGKEPLFIFDPADDSNRPVSGVHTSALVNWPRVPKPLSALFRRAFGEGLSIPDQRPRLTEWLAAMLQVRDCLFQCASCGRQTVYERDGVTSQTSTVECRWCKAKNNLPLRMKINDDVVVLSTRTRLATHYIGKRYCVDDYWAEVVGHPTKPGRWGLRNTSQVSWRYVGKDGTPHTVEPGRAMPLVAGAKVQIDDRHTAVVRA